MTGETPRGVELLLRSEEPLIRYRALVDLLDVEPSRSDVAEARAEIPEGRIVRALTAETPALHPYSKWQGAHWRLVSLMDLGAPPDLPGVRDAIEPVFGWLTRRRRGSKLRSGVLVINNLVRHCASQEGNALAVAVHFGLVDDPRTKLFVELLLDWQWPDGGWNCHRAEDAHHSSVNESFPALRGLAAFARATADEEAGRAATDGADRVVDFFLRHRVAFSEQTGEPIHPAVVRLRYPPYWHYDFLVGLRALAESGQIGDPRTADALDLLESRRRQDGSWSPDGAHYKPRTKASSLIDVVDWDDVSADRPSEPLTLSAMLVLKAAGRLQHESERALSSSASPGPPNRSRRGP